MPQSRHLHVLLAELIEFQVGTRATAQANVQVLEGCEAVDLLTDPSRDPVTGVRLRSRDGRAERPALPPTWRPISWWTPAAGDPAPQWLAALEVANGNPKVIVWTIGAAVSLGGAVYAAGLLAWWGGQALGLRILGWVLMVMPW